MTPADLTADDLRYARAFAWPRAMGFGLDLDDLVSAAFEGLVHAALHFDPARGVWRNCRFHWVRAYVMRQAKRNRMVRRKDGLEFAQIVPLENWTAPTVDPEYRDDPEELLDRAGLAEKERAILIGHASGASLSEIGARLGVCRERVRQIEGQALLRVRVACGIPG